MVTGLGFKEGLGFRVWGYRLRFKEGFGFRVWGYRFRV